MSTDDILTERLYDLEQKIKREESAVASQETDPAVPPLHQLDTERFTELTRQVSCALREAYNAGYAKGHAAALAAAEARWNASRELLEEIYQGHRDKDAYDSDWEYLDGSDASGPKCPMEDQPCEWCVKTAALLREPPATKEP